VTPRKALPAFLGGLFMGVLSVLPIVNAANACCCLWVVIGGVLAAWVMQQNHPFPVTPGQGALVGFLAGLIGFGVMLVASIPVAYFQGTMMEGFSESLLRQEGMTPEMRDMLQQVGPGVIFALAGVSMFGAHLVFGTVGGLIGAAIFRTTAPPPPPVPVPPPPPEPFPWTPPVAASPDVPPPAADPEAVTRTMIEPPADEPPPPVEDQRPKTED
jgi:hypothetical protein